MSLNTLKSKIMSVILRLDHEDRKKKEIEGPQATIDIESFHRILENKTDLSPLGSKDIVSNVLNCAYLDELNNNCLNELMNASSKKFSSELENTSKYVVKYNKQINKLTFSPDVDHITKNRCIEQVDGQEEYFPSFHASIESNPLDLNDGNNKNNSIM